MNAEMMMTGFSLPGNVTISHVTAPEAPANMAGGIKGGGLLFKALMAQSLAQSIGQGPLAVSGGEEESDLPALAEAPMIPTDKILWDLQGVKASDNNPNEQEAPGLSEDSLTIPVDLGGLARDVHGVTENTQKESREGGSAYINESTFVNQNTSVNQNTGLKVGFKETGEFPGIPKGEDGLNLPESIKEEAKLTGNQGLAKEGLAQAGEGKETSFVGEIKSAEGSGVEKGEIIKEPSLANDAKAGGIGVEKPAEASTAASAAVVAATGEVQTNQVSVKAAEEPYSQIGKEVQAKLSNKGPMEFTMELEPKNLGKIDVKLKISEGRLVIDIMAASAKTQALLSSQVDKLVMSLGLQNVKVENVQISHQQDVNQTDKQEQGFLMGKENSHGHENAKENMERRGQTNKVTQGSLRVGDLNGSDQDPNSYGFSRGISKSDFSRMDYKI